MAVYESCTVVTMTAGGDLRSDIYKSLQLNSAGRVVLTDAVTDVIIGYLAENPRSDIVTTGIDVPVVIVGGGGRMKARAAAAVTRGHLIVPSAVSGKEGQVQGIANIAALVANQMAVGYALETAAEDQVFEVLGMTIAGPNA